MPLDGALRAAWHVPGQPVQRQRHDRREGAGTVRAQRAHGVRVRRRPAFAMVLVGALFVGSMSTVWHGEMTPRRRRRALDAAARSAARSMLARGAELGRFNMGSTVILLLPAQARPLASAISALAAPCASASRSAVSPRRCRHCIERYPAALAAERHAGHAQGACRAAGAGPAVLRRARRAGGGHAGADQLLRSPTCISIRPRCSCPAPAGAIFSCTLRPSTR